jgi:hypothetical protein
MSLAPRSLRQYHVFLASPGDVGAERQYVRKFFDEYNRHTAHIWRARFEVVDWENYATIGVGRPQELITQQTLDTYRDSLALVVGIMGQRFGSPSGKAESGTEEEFNWAMESHDRAGFPEIKWFFRKVERLELPADPDEADAALDQWKKVRAFRKRMQDLKNPVFYTEYPNAAGFAEVFERDLNQWLADPARPWAAEHAAHVAAGGAAVAVALPAEFDPERYQAAVLKRFDKLNFEMLDTTGAFYTGVRLWSVFIPQSVRECHQYNPRLLEIPKEDQERLLKAGEITAAELAQAEQQTERLREEYFSQPLRAVLDVIAEALTAASSRGGQRLVILGDPGSGKSSLIRYLALRWARIGEPTVRDTQRIPLVVELGSYGRWQCDGRKGFVRFLEEAPIWHEWPRGLLDRLLAQPGRAVLLLDALDEVFDVNTRDAVINDIQRFSSESIHTPVIVTSRVVGYQPQRLRDADFRHFMLQDLDPVQIGAFIDRWHAETFDSEEQAAPKRERLKKAIHGSKSIAMLAGNPLLLTMMAILNRNQELPRDRADLYAQASRLLLHQWDTERALVDFPGLSAEIGLREKTDILRRVASHMQAAPGGLKGNLIDGATLTELIEHYLREELHFDQARAAARTVVEHLRQRNFILCFVGADSYAFVHRTFLEYFCAAEFVHRFNVAKTLDIDGLIALFDEHCRQDEWREVLRLICGQIDEAFVARIVERLATRTDLKKWNGKTPRPELPLAIGCLSEARNIARLEDAGRTLVESLLRIYIPGKGGKDFHEQLLVSQREIGTRWPGTGSLYTTVLNRESELGDAEWAVPFLVKFLACVRPNRQVVEKLLASKKPGLRWGAVEALAETWPDDVTRSLLAQRAVQDENYRVRSVALQMLAENWPDERTRALLAERGVKDDDDDPRTVALQMLARKWPDEATRALLAERAVRDVSYAPRRAALQALAEKWPDEATRALLAQRAVEDDRDAARRFALQALAEKWPDDMTRALLEGRAVKDDNEYARIAAFQSLAEKWPDDTTRALLEGRAVKDDNKYARIAAFQSLAENWSDESTRALLAQRAVQDDDHAPRRAALEALAQNWPDEATRALLSQRAVQDDNDRPRRAALEALAENWPDESTRALLVQRAVQDDHDADRRAALRALAANWPDETTRALLADRAVQDDDDAARHAALRALAANWPDETTCALLAQRAAQDENYRVRSVALQMLCEKWPDDRTRALLAERALQDDDDDLRTVALQTLAKEWPDEATRALLAERAVRDVSYAPRAAALQALVAKWPDGATRALLATWATEAPHHDVRRAALQALAENWPDEATRAVFAQRAVDDPDEQVRRFAFFSLSKMHSEFGRILPTGDLDGWPPYLDPREPISRDHIQKAASKAGIRPDDIDAQVASLSAYLGWYITRGPNPPGEDKVRRTRTKKGRQPDS